MFFGSGVEVADGAADVLFVALSTLSLVDAFSSVAQIVLQQAFLQRATEMILSGTEGGPKTAILAYGRQYCMC